MHDGSHEWVLISGTQNALQHALLLSPLLRFTGWLLMSVCLNKIQFQSLLIGATFKKHFGLYWKLLQSAVIEQGRRNYLKEIWDSDQIMIMSKHNQHHQINFSLCSSGSYISDTTAKQNLMLTV